MTLKKYDEIMENIKVTEEMRNRILKNIEEENISKKNKVIQFAKYRRYLSIAACLAVIVMGAITVPSILHDGWQESEQGVVTSPGIMEASSADELSQNVGFDIEDIRSLKDSANEVYYTSYDNEMAEITYYFGEQSISYRKSVGTEDNSGDYTQYSAVKNVRVSNYEVSIKGNEDLLHVAIWNDGEYAFSICTFEGISEQKMLRIIDEVIENQ